MTFAFRTTRFAGIALALILVVSFAFVESDLRPSCASVSAANAKPFLHQDQGWVLSVPSSLIANSPVTGTVEGGPPAAGGAPPPFSISIELNGWPHKAGVATYNQDTGKWEFDIVVPPGSTGADMRIVLIPDVGEPVTTIVKIT